MLSCEASQVRPTTPERRVEEGTRRACSVCLIDTEEKEQEERRKALHWSKIIGPLIMEKEEDNKSVNRTTTLTKRTACEGGD